MKIIKFNDKFSEKDLDKFIDKLYKDISNNRIEKYIFDLTEVSWISNQELLVFTSTLKYFVHKNIDFEVTFFKRGISIKDIHIRVALQIIQIWDVWKIWQIIPHNDYDKYFGIDGSSIEKLKKIHNIKSSNNEIYNRYNITPFITLDNIQNYDDRIIEDVLNSFYKLNEATREIVSQSNCEHPFVNSTIGSIITKELYENFLDHFSSSFFNSDKNWAFMSLSLKTKLKDKDNTQKILEGNFKTEALSETLGFFHDKQKKEYKNQPYLQFSFLDFGNGIVETLRDQYKIDTSKVDELIIDDAEVLKYAFTHSSSRHPINDRYNKREESIPRGLFDIISVVKRYEGLIIIRSNHGKILYDFSNNNNIETAFSKFGDEELFFPGTLISVYLPAITIKKTDSSSIKPTIEKHSYTSKDKVHIDIYHTINKLKSKKKDLYTNLLGNLSRDIKNSSNRSRTIFLSFRGYENDVRLTKKILFFLLSDYEININNNVVILHPPSIDIFNEINDEILTLSDVIKNYKIHPLPFVYFNDKEDDIKLYWLGIYDKDDKIQLDNLLFEDFPLSRTDFIDPDNLTGNNNYFDQLGNLKSNLPNREALINYYKNESYTADNIEVEKMIINNKCLSPINPKQFYLCNGNYYQYSFIEIIHLLNNQSDCNLVSEILFMRISEKISVEKYNYVGITSSSHKILNSMINQGFVSKENVHFFENYHTFNNDENSNSINKNEKYILVCDAIATGSLTKKLSEKLEQFNSQLSVVAVIANTIDENFENSNSFLSEIGDKLISIYTHKIEKYRRTHSKIKKDIKQNEIIRINPFTNIPITLSIEKTNYLESIIISNTMNYDENENLIINNNYFLDEIDEDQIKIGYLKFNNVIHPYFFDTVKILKNASRQLLKIIFDKINIKANDLENLKIFYPKNSGIQYLDFTVLKNEILLNHSIKEFELERFPTKEGWKFPHTTDFFNQIINNETVLILDDGSCSGDSIMQMIDEIAFFKNKEIIVLSFIGRINDHKREFFSRISNIKTAESDNVKIKIYFATHWHIPTYYIDENPNSSEQKWLNEVQNYQNVPDSIKKIAKKILREIEPKEYNPLNEKSVFPDYAYLPKIKNTGLIPKKEILKVREEIGKIIGYRFYKENFTYFNLLIKKYELANKNNTYKEIELLCAVFIFEPYLYQKIKEVVPDIVSRVEDFVRALIFGNTKNQIIDLEKELYYTWSRKDIIHLFFIVFTDEKLILESTNEKFIQLIKFSEPIESNLNYILYKLLYYFPLNKNEIKAKKHSAKILFLLTSINIIDPNIKINQIKRFISFLLTLPSSEDFNHSLFVINEEYDKILKEKFHNNNIIFFLETISIKLAFLKNEYDENVVKEIEENWSKASGVIEKLLSFKTKFPDFFAILSKDDIRLVDNYRSIQGETANIIYNIDKNTNFSDLDKLISSQIRAIFIQENCVFKIFINVKSNVEKLLLTFIQDIQQKYPASNVVNNFIDRNTIIPIPQYIFYDILLFEILENFRHTDLNHPINISIEYVDNLTISITISNHCLDNDSNKGSGIGTDRIKLIDKFPGIDIKYLNKKTSKIYEQKINIKLT